MKQPDFAKWYFYQLLKDYEGEQLYLNELGYVYGNEEKTNEIVKIPILHQRGLPSYPRCSSQTLLWMGRVQTWS